METTTANSGTGFELRPEKFPPLDAGFFEPFLPELYFAVAVAIAVALGHWIFARLSDHGGSGIPVEPIPNEAGRRESAREAIANLDENDPEMASKAWGIFRAFIAETTGRSELFGMTADEVARELAADWRAEGMARLAREAEYAPGERLLRARELQARLLDFLSADR